MYSKDEIMLYGPEIINLVLKILIRDPENPGNISSDILICDPAVIQNITGN